VDEVSRSLNDLLSDVRVHGCECVAEVRVDELAVIVLVETLDEGRDVILVGEEAEVLEGILQLNVGYEALT
jgi:hypothetical protein